jgi:hypothetical protein
MPSPGVQGRKFAEASNIVAEEVLFIYLRVCGVSPGNGKTFTWKHFLKERVGPDASANSVFTKVKVLAWFSKRTDKLLKPEAH